MMVDTLHRYNCSVHKSSVSGNVKKSVLSYSLSRIDYNRITLRLAIPKNILQSMKRIFSCTKQLRSILTIRDWRNFRLIRACKKNMRSWWPRRNPCIQTIKKPRRRCGNYRLQKPTSIGFWIWKFRNLKKKKKRSSDKRSAHSDLKIAWPQDLSCVSGDWGCASTSRKPPISASARMGGLGHLWPQMHCLLFFVT